MEKTLTPRALGFAMPAEWAPHAATWTAWPHDEEQWAGYLEPVRQEFAAFVDALARFEPVHLIVADEEAEADAKARLKSGNV
ncbi:agmatine deiminase family protein, partial [Escherichia coli]|nr:agmatine deiminase family protein [Escherichia coli]